MDYLLWVLVALLAYAVVAPVMSIVTREVPPTPGLFLATAVFLVIATGVMLATGTADPSYAFTREAVYVYVAGVFLTVGILSYTAALEAGPVSIVVPIFGMFIVGSSVLGILFLDESLTATRAAGIGCAVLAIWFSTGDGE
ncbi:EamA family transporter [Natronobacterium texcoconense]|uniref:Transporter family protein n=1 Tax=Natronobacterium texcoconense TaxID=1095778 RepID=A0A1H1AGA7_NATTX|nr:EamA family transporter [Natronobacterium texcoconense]SDQ38698.1 transporter family protein [Natronobacterium texcoconense]